MTVANPDPHSVSVVIPAYNAVSFIRNAIDSVLAQTSEPLEIIVIDDGSEDNLYEFLTKHYLGKFSYYRQDNQGVAVARNYGVRLARGELIAFLDADDCWHPEKLEHQLNAFKAIDDLGLCYTGFVSRNFSESHYEFDENLPGGDTKPEVINDFSRIFLNPYFGTPGVIVRKKLFEGIGGFDASFKKAEDVDLWLRYSYLFKVAVIPAALYVINVRRGGLSYSMEAGGYYNNLRVIEKFCREQPGFAKNYSAVVRKASHNVYLQWGRSDLEFGYYTESRKALWQAIKIKPSAETVYLLLKAVVLKAINR